MQRMDPRKNRLVESEVSIDHRADWKVEHRSRESAVRQKTDYKPTFEDLSAHYELRPL